MLGLRMILDRLIWTAKSKSESEQSGLSSSHVAQVVWAK